MSSQLPRVLFVDDEQNVLIAITRSLRGRFAMTLATGGDEALQFFSAGQHFDAIVSDMRMPNMDGVGLLSRVRLLAPDTVRIILSGHADMESAVRAVNDGSIFRFLVKPVDRDTLGAVLDAAVAQHRLVIAEREVLEKTLTGAVNALTEVLALTNPVAFGRARRIRRIATAIADELKVPQRWPIEVAAMLTQIGAVTLPPDTAARWYANRPLSEEEHAMVLRMPRVGDKLLAHIPRLEPVRAILLSLEGGQEAAPAAIDLSLGANIVKTAVKLEQLLSRGGTVAEAVAAIRASAPGADALVLEACLRLKALVLGQGSAHEISITSLKEGMVLADDVRTRAGALLISRGHEVTYGLLAHLRNYAKTVGVAEPIRVEATGEELPPSAAGS